MIAVFGAGSIGCWVGGRLAAAGAEVTLIGRARVMDEIGAGLRVTDLDGFDRTVHVKTSTTPEAAAAASTVIVTVKSAGTPEVARALGHILADGAIVISLQNGVRNADVLRAALPRRPVVAGMVPFNVVRPGAGTYHRASAGTLMIDRTPAAPAFVDAARATELAVELRDDMAAVQWAKLVLNLNNAINALAGIPLAAELAQRDYRRVVAAAQREALDLLAADGQRLARLTAIPPRWMPRLLGLPDGVFRRVAARVIAIDPHARSSMWDDLEARRPTEIDYIQGEIVAIADRLGRDAPVNRALIRLIRAAEAGDRRTYTGGELRTAVGI
jgi:2-dehydropantoate 2-reductase